MVASDSARSTGRSESTKDNSEDTWARSADGVRPASTHGTTAGAGTSDSASTVIGGACSMIACALVPLTPNEDTAARYARPVSGHAVASVSSRTAPVVQSTWVDGLATCRVFGTRSCRMAMTILITPATPAAACVCPRFDLIEPSSSGCSRFWP
ncbi:hypothetical protein GCM10027199_36070 [Amycolatopsis magusensis]